MNLFSSFKLEISVVKGSNSGDTTYYGVDNIEIKLLESYDDVFHCSFDLADSQFDLDDCKFDLNANDSKYIAIRENIVFGSNVFTDVTSTSK